MEINNLSNKENISCGAYLKSVREQKGISLEKAIQDLKLVRAILKAIEEDNYQILPPPVFLKGMIKKYAQYLQLDEKRVLEIYQKSKDRHLSSGSKDILPQNRFITSRFRFLQFLSLCLRRAIQLLPFILILIYFVFELGQFILPAKIILYYPPQNFVTSDANLEVFGRVIRCKILYLQNKEIRFDNKGYFKEQLTLNPGLNILELKAINALNKETILQQNVVLSNY